MSRKCRLAAILLSAEALVTELIGRPFAIDGAFELELLPAITVVAERVRVGNADWGSQPQMVKTLEEVAAAK